MGRGQGKGEDGKTTDEDIVSNRWQALGSLGLALLVVVISIVCATLAVSVQTLAKVKKLAYGSQTISIVSAMSPPSLTSMPSTPAAPAAAGMKYYLNANSSTTQWGFYSYTSKPKLYMNSGETVTVEMITHHAGDFFDGMIKGDAGIQDIYKWGQPGMYTSPLPGPTPGTTIVGGQRGASGAGDGVHVLTGPIYVNGAVPGDVIKVDVLDLRPRVNPATGKTFGINAAAWWGYSYGLNGPSTTSGMSTGSATTQGMKYLTGAGPKIPNMQREMTTVYQIVTSDNSGSSASAMYATPAFQFQYGRPGSIVTPCLAASVLGPSVSVPCVNGSQTWLGYEYPGLITQHLPGPTGTYTDVDYSVANKWQVPINFHIGSMGLAPASPAFVDSIPPMVAGGNMDDRRLGIGATMYFKVAVNGGLLSMGDAHTAQGDSELDGTGIETSITGDFKITLIKQGPAMPAMLSGLNFPLLENANEYVVHGFTYTDYLTELGYADISCGNAMLGCATANVYFKSNIGMAMTNAHKQGIKFLASLGYSEDQATSMITVSSDFGITQIVDGNWGVHLVIPKYVLAGAGAPQTAAYTQSTSCGGSIPSISAAAPAGPVATKWLLQANASTVNWGYYSRTLAPAITIASGDTITVEMITHHAGDYFDGMIKGDPGILDIYKWGPASQSQDPAPGGAAPGTTTFSTGRRGASGAGDGVHILTGPIAVAGAVPGDVLKVDVLALRPRVNPATGKTFGINAAAWWGYNYGINGPQGYNPGVGKFPTKAQEGYTTGDPTREMTTVYQIVNDATGAPMYASPVMQYRYGQPGATATTCVNSTSPSQPGNILTFNPGVAVPCVKAADGNYYQNWTGYQFPGLITKQPVPNTDFSVANKWQVPINFHIGSMGLAPASPAFVDSVPPMVTGGNLDDRRLGVGATMYYKVAVNGGLLSMGDAHTAQGDSELDGTGIETSITGDFKITLIKAAALPGTPLAGINSPVLENANEYVLHGFTIQDYLTELGYANDTRCASKAAPSPIGCSYTSIYSVSDLDMAVANAYKLGRSFLMNLGFSEDSAISALTVACDFGVTQVVDGNFGAHLIIPKYILSGNQTAPYQRKTMCQTSMPAAMYRTA